MASQFKEDAVPVHSNEAGASEAAEPLRLGGGERVLRREDFCEAWVETITARAALLGDYVMLTPEEREASRQAFLSEIGPESDAWVFAYGSLMWNPAIH
ncbi:MAG: hypothetical protein JO010_00300, partial [Alphaproteobacteria bacterium]|nr:hypothetical protein [Alphaproteobacteria bacterium]